jgi:hypothetical protein
MAQEIDASSARFAGGLLWPCSTPPQGGLVEDWGGPTTEYSKRITAFIIVIEKYSSSIAWPSAARPIGRNLEGAKPLQ